MATTRCEDYFERISKVMPYGSSTASKAALYRPEEPALVERAAGCRVWDVDGREFIDFRNGLGPITLGYGYPAVDEGPFSEGNGHEYAGDRRGRPYGLCQGALFEYNRLAGI